MKWIMAIAAVLAIPALAFGAASFTITSGGSSAITIAPGASFVVDIGISHDFVGVSGMDMALISSSSGIFSSTARTYAITQLQKSVPSDLVIFNTTNAPMLTSGLNGQNLGGTHSTNYWAGSPLDVVDVTVQEVGGIPGTYNITLGPAGTAWTVLDQYYSIVVPTAGTLSVTVVPEPASMLLLIGALPFLRRRRSA